LMCSTDIRHRKTVFTVRRAAEGDFQRLIANPAPRWAALALPGAHRRRAIRALIDKPPRPVPCDVTVDEANPCVHREARCLYVCSASCGRRSRRGDQRRNVRFWAARSDVSAGRETVSDGSSTRPSRHRCRRLQPQARACSKAPTPVRGTNNSAIDGTVWFGAKAKD